MKIKEKHEIVKSELEKVISSYEFVTNYEFGYNEDDLFFVTLNWTNNTHILTLTNDYRFYSDYVEVVNKILNKERIIFELVKLNEHEGLEEPMYIVGFKNGIHVRACTKEGYETFESKNDSIKELDSLLLKVKNYIVLSSLLNTPK